MSTELDLNTLMSIRSLEIRARRVVEGFWAGLNRSPYHGFSVEFSEYRQYTPGDDPRYLDWRLAARTDRYYVRRFEDETNLRSLLMLDVSRSMMFGSVGYSKLEYARTLAATLAYLLLQQRDAVGAATFTTVVEGFEPDRFRTGQFHRLLSLFDRAPEGTETGLAAPLAWAAGAFRRRGLVVLISDFLSPARQWANALHELLSRRHDAIVIQVLDPSEISLGFTVPVQLEDMETGELMPVDPASVRADYQTAICRNIRRNSSSFSKPMGCRWSNYEPMRNCRRCCRGY